MAIDRTEHGPRPPSLFWPLTLITFGAVLLLQNFGMLPWAFWGTVWRFWPILIVLVGVHMFFGHRHPWIAAGLSIVLLTSSVVGAAWLAHVQFYGPFTEYAFEGAQKLALREQVISEDIGSLERARVELRLPAGRMELGRLPSDSGKLVEARISRGAGQPDIQPTMTRRGGDGVLRIESNDEFVPGGDSTALWSVMLSPDVPLDLDLKIGAGEHDLELSELRVSKLTVETGAGKTLVNLPAEGGHLQVLAKAGVGDIEVIVPEGVAARINAEAGLGSVEIDEARFPHSGDAYVSPNYEKAENRVDLRIEAGAGSVKVR